MSSLLKGILILAPFAPAPVGSIIINGTGTVFDHQIFGAGLGFVKGQGMWFWDQATNQFRADLYDDNVAVGNNIGDIYGNWTQPNGGNFPNIPWFVTANSGNMNLINTGGIMRSLIWVAL